MAHTERLENNRTTLLRCINLNVVIVAGLREEGLIDEAKESRLEAEKAHHDRVCLLIDWIKESSDEMYESFLRVMEENEQQHVANLLRGNREDNHVPLSLARHTRLLKIRRKLVLMIHNSAILIAALKGSCAISQTDAEDLSVDRLPNYKKNFLLINVILRRSDYSFECLHQALGSTHQQDAADYLIEGEVIPVHLNTTRPDLDEPISESINTAVMNESMDETAAMEIEINESMDETVAKEIHLPQLNGIRIVGATPGHSIVVLIYCKTIDNMVTFTRLFNSGELHTKLEKLLNHMFTRIEPKSTERLKSSIRLDNEDILEIEEITGIEDWMKLQETKLPMSGPPLESGKSTEVEEKETTETLSLSDWMRLEKTKLLQSGVHPDVDEKSTHKILSVLRRRPEWKQDKPTFFEMFESLLSEEEELLTIFQNEKATSDQGQNWNMLIEELGQMFDAQTSICNRLLSSATSGEGFSSTSNLRPFPLHHEFELQEQQDQWRNLRQRMDFVQFGHVFQPRFGAFINEKIDLLLDDVRHLKRKLRKVKEISGKDLQPHRFCDYPRRVRTSLMKESALTSPFPGPGLDLYGIDDFFYPISRPELPRYPAFSPALSSGYSTRMASPPTLKSTSELRFGKSKFDPFDPPAKIESKRDNVLPVFGNLMKTIRTKAAEEQNKYIAGFTILKMELFVVNGKSSEVEVYNATSFKFSRQWTLKELIHPLDIASCNTNTCLYIINRKCPNCVSCEILKVDGEGIVSRTWSIENDWSYGLSVTNECNVILVVHQKNKLNEYSPDGTLIREIQFSPDSAIVHPWHAIKLNNGDLVVSHGSRIDTEHRVCKVDAEGHLKTSFGGTAGSAVGQLLGPRYLALGENESVLVSDRNNKRVLLLNSDLKFKMELIPRISNGLRDPRKIHLDTASGRLFVADKEYNARQKTYKNCRILVFKMTT